MSLRFADSFNHYQTSDLATNGKWTSLILTNMIIDSGTGRFGGNSLKQTNLSSMSYLTKTIDSQSTWIIGGAFKLNGTIPQANTIFALYDNGTNQVDLRLNADQTFTVTRNGTALTNNLNGLTKSNVSIPINVWNYIEWKMVISSSIPSGSCLVVLNGNSGSPIINVSGTQSTKNTGNATANQVMVGPSLINGTFTSCNYCDLYVCDGNGAAPWNNFLGDCRVAFYSPISGSKLTANNAWSVSGVASAVTAVSQQYPSGDKAIIYNSGSNQISTFQFAPLPTNISNIYGVQTVWDGRKDDAGTRMVADCIVVSGNTYPGAIQSVTSSYTDYLNIWTLNPVTNQQLTASDFNSIEIGVSGV